MEKMTEEIENNRQGRYREYYNETNRRATYSRGGVEYETHAFQEWLRRRYPPNMVDIFTNVTLDNDYISPNTRTIPFNKDIIVITDNRVYLFSNYIPNIICDSKIDVVSKVLDERKEEELFTFKIGNIEYPSYTINGIIRKLGKKIFIGKKGTDVVAHLIEEISKTLDERKSIYIPGWNNGWYTPMDEEEKGFTIVHYSEEQRSTWNNCKNMYKEYSPEEKEEIKNKLQEFVKLTDMPEAYKAITIGLALMVPFRLYFIKKFGIFPHLALYGRTTAGKTHWLDFWTTHFTKHRLKHMSGKTASSATRIESAMTGFTGAVMVDDYKIKSSYDATDMEMVLKESATGISLRKRMRSDGITFSDNREVISSIFTTSNELGELMLKSAIMARCVSLCYDNPIVVNKDWIKLELELIQEKPFSLLYDYTKKWTDKHLDKLVEVTEKNKSLNYINPNIVDILYPKLLSIYKIALAGCLLAKKLYGVKLETKDIWKTLIEARRTAVKEFIGIFLSYCKWAIHLDPAKPIPRYLTMQLTYNSINKVYVLSYPCLRDWIKFYGGYTNDLIKFKLSTLFERLFEALEFKDLIKLGYIWHDGKNIRGIWINPILIHVGDVEPTEKGIEIIHRQISEEGEDEEREYVEFNKLNDNLDIDKDIKVYDGALGKAVNFNREDTSNL